MQAIGIHWYLQRVNLMPEIQSQPTITLQLTGLDNCSNLVTACNQSTVIIIIWMQTTVQWQEWQRQS